jgi:hypothetical protein
MTQLTQAYDDRSGGCKTTDDGVREKVDEESQTEKAHDELNEADHE